MKTKCLNATSFEAEGIEQGRISQIWRPLRIQPEVTPGQTPTPIKEWKRQGEEMMSRGLVWIHTSGPGSGMIFPNAPYQIGDVLWVKSSTKQRMAIDESGKDHFRYQANTQETARLWLRVTGMRTERLQQMTAQDATNKGIQAFFTGAGFRIPLNKFGVGHYRTGSIVDAGITHFHIVHKIKRDENPFIWIIEFEKIPKPE